MTSNPTPDYTATVVERTIVVRWPDNARLGATPPPDGWQERAWAEPTLHEIDEGSVSGCSVLRWRDDPRPDNVLLAVSLALVSGQPAVPSVSAVDQTTRDRIAEAPVDRAALSAKLWEVAEQHIVAEWICCEPVEPGHTLCAKGYAALGMVKTLLVDGDPEKVWNPSAPLLDAVLAVLPPDGHTTNRADVLLWAAEAIEAEQAREEATEWAQQGELDHETEIGGGYVRHSAALLRRLAAEAPQPECTDPIECSHEAALGEAQARLDKVQRWVASDVVTARTSFGDGYREAQRDISDLLDGRTPVPCSWVAVKSSHSPHDWQPQPGMDAVRCPGYSRPVAGVQAARHAPGKAILCPDCAAKGHAVCQPAAVVPAAGAGQDETQEASRVVAYRVGGHALHCIGCTPSPRGDIWEPVTSEDLPDGGLCSKCDVDVLIPQNGAEQ